MFTDGTTQESEVEIGATSRITVNVNTAVGADKEVSVKITSDGPIVAERPMYFNYNGTWTGGHDVIGLAAPQTSFYFAEGYTGTGTFDEYLCLMNPNDSGHEGLPSPTCSPTAPPRSRKWRSGRPHASPSTSTSRWARTRTSR